jgi:hypothetical protein
MSPAVKIYTDLPCSTSGLHYISEVADTQYHRDVELAIVNADQAGYTWAPFGSNTVNA